MRHTNFRVGFAILIISLVAAFGGSPRVVEGAIYGEGKPTPTPFGQSLPSVLRGQGQFNPSGVNAPDSTGNTGWEIRPTPIVPRLNEIRWSTFTPTPRSEKK